MENIVVTNSSELNAAIRALEDTGGTIEVVASETPYTLTAYQLGSATETIRIVAADADNPPDFQNITLNQCQNFAFEGLLFDSSGDASRTGRDFNIYSSSNITFTDNTFTSRATGFYDPADPDAMLGKSVGYIASSDGFTFEGNSVSNVYMGVALTDTTNTRITDNTFTDMIGDGVRMGGAVDTLIEGNSFSHCYGSVQTFNHSDFIQVWSTHTNEQLTENLTIRDNLFNSSGGAATQSIFINHETFQDTGEHYRNIVIENNTILNGHTNGIVVNYSDGVRVANNTVLWDQVAGMQVGTGTDLANSPPTIRLTEVVNGVIEYNIATRVTAPDGNIIQNNVALNYFDPTDPDYVNNHFVNATGSGVLDARDLALLPDSPWDGVYGAQDSCLTDLHEPGTVVAVVRQYATPENPNHIYYDAGESLGANPETATYRWVFDDGTVLEGRTVDRVYDTSGTMGFDLDVTCVAGTDTVHRETSVKALDLLTLDFEGSIEDTGSYGTTLLVSGAENFVTGVAGTGQGFVLDGTSKIGIDRADHHLRALETFTLGVSIKTDPTEQAGTFLHMHDGIGAVLNADGSLKFAINTTDGWVSATTDPGLVTADTWHRVTVAFNGTAETGGLKLYVDGVLAATADAQGTFVAPSTGTLFIGNTFSDSMRGAVDKLYIVKGVLDAAAIDTEYRTAHALDMPVVDDVPDTTPPADSILLDLGFTDGAVDQSSYDSTVAASAEGLDAEGVAGAGFRLDGATRIFISRDNTQLRALDSFTLSVSLQRDAGDTGGVLMHMTDGLEARVDADGALHFGMATTDGWVALSTEPGLLADTDWHRIHVVLDDAADTLTLYVDEAAVASTEATGSFAAPDGAHLFVGSSLDKAAGPSLRGVVDDLRIGDAAIDPATAQAEHVEMQEIESNEAAVEAYAALFKMAIGDEQLVLNEDPPSDLTDGSLLDGETSQEVLGSMDIDISAGFSLSMALQGDADGDGSATTTLARLGDVFEASLTEDRALRVQITTEKGSFEAVSDPGAISDTAFQKLVIAYDGTPENSGLAAFVDGHLVALNVEASGLIGTQAGASLEIGGDLSADALISDHSLSPFSLDIETEQGLHTLETTVA